MLITCLISNSVSRGQASLHCWLTWGLTWGRYDRNDMIHRIHMGGGGGTVTDSEISGDLQYDRMAKKAHK